MVSSEMDLLLKIFLKKNLSCMIPCAFPKNEMPGDNKTNFPRMHISNYFIDTVSRNYFVYQ
jgi:hypothetical protein